jgi:ATP-dependent helicase/nuclease subunit B
LLSALRDRDLLPITTAIQGRTLEVADEVIHNVSESYREELAPAIPRIWEGEVEDIRWDIRGWLREMTQAEGEAGWKPQWFELAFGLPVDRDRDPASRSEAVDLPGGLHLRGSIDMIEERLGHIRITDHKTGRVPVTPPGLTGRGEVLQPILYAQAAEAVLGKTADSARLFYCTERGGYRSIDVPINDEARGALTQVVGAIDAAITTGFLPAAPREGACAWCDYRVVCGPYEEIRVRRKPKDRLSSLDQLRKSL